MTARRPGGFVLTADIAGLGNFVTVGRMPVPSPAFAAALRDLRIGPAGPELREGLVHSLAVSAAGLCILDSPEIERALHACMPAGLVFEWRIAFPGTGVLQALFFIAKLTQAQSGAAAELALQLAGKPAFSGVQNGGAGLLSQDSP
ncbi:MAG: hypothetical protein ACLPPF_13040 [Rhodomicrobium sp.]